MNMLIKITVCVAAIAGGLFGGYAGGLFGVAMAAFSLASLLAAIASMCEWES